ncbi:hypothetical protein DITRI_Ditri07aG0009100 [Diplodiscus trichospermus]
MGKTIATGEESTERTVIQEEVEIENGGFSLEISPVQELVEEFQSRLNLLDNSQHVAPDYCIFMLPGELLDENMALYVPRFACVGPFYIRDQALWQAEEQKKIYMASFLLRAKHRTVLKDFITLIKESLANIQGCYMKPYYQFANNFVEKTLIEIVFVDAVFILELFLRTYFKEWRVENDVIFAQSWRIQDIKRDMMLPHNQLPFFILRDMYELAFSGNPDFPSFLHLTCHFFSHYYYNQTISIKDVLSTNNPHPEYRSRLEDAKNFADLVRTFQLPYSFKKEKKHFISEESQCWKWIIRAKHNFMTLISSKPKENNEPEEILEDGKMQGDYLYNAVLLLEAGVKFKVGLGKCLCDIEFDQSNGELKIPPLRVDNSTESFFANLMFLEKFCYPNDTYICNYILLMQYLIKSVEDVDLLVRRRIIINQLGSPEAIVALFNCLCKDIRMENNRYSVLFKRLNAYNAVRRHGWIAILKLQYFSTPWKGVATIAATILLVLTLIQTICALISF